MCKNSKGDWDKNVKVEQAEVLKMLQVSYLNISILRLKISLIIFKQILKLISGDSAETNGLSVFPVKGRCVKGGSKSLALIMMRSEERRVGKEGRSGWWP